MLTTLTSYGKIDLQRQGELLVGGGELDQEAPITRREFEQMLKDFLTSGLASRS